MDKVHLVVWDIIDVSDQWLGILMNEDFYEVVSLIRGTENDSELKKAADQSEWDYFVVFVQSDVVIVLNIMALIGIPEEKIIFPLTLTKEKIKERDFLRNIFLENADEWIDSRIDLEQGFYLEKMMGKRYITCTTKDNISYISESTDDVLLHQMYTSRENWAKKEIELFLLLAKKFYGEKKSNGIFFDIGANIGTTAIYVKKKVLPDLRVIAFEPMPEIFKLLKINMLLNDIPEDEYILVNMGISDQTENRKMRYHKFNLGGSSFVEQIANERDEEILVKNIAFDDYIMKNQIAFEDISYLWIDIEGFEAMFLLGARNTLSQIDVPILMEYSPAILKKGDMYDLFIEQITGLYSHYIVIQEMGTIYPTSMLRERDDTQVDIFLLKELPSLL